MDTFWLITTLLATFGSVFSNTPCLPDGCKNLSVYLGPKWGSKTIPNYPKLFGPGEEESRRISEEVKNRNAHWADEVRTTVSSKPEYILTRVKPIPDDDSIVINYVDEVDDQPTPAYGVDLTPTNGYPPLVDVNKLPFEMGTLNMSGLNINGNELKKALAFMSTDRKQNLRRLILSNNNIRFLPPLVWPLELEYGLQELLLDNNPFSYLSSFTRFELSRLGKLQRLSLSKTGLLKVDSLYLPSLEALDLSHNHLYYLPRLGTLSNLQALDLSHNRISGFFDSTIAVYANLRDLDLSHNYISFISDDSLPLLDNLQRLHLNNNSLQVASEVQLKVAMGVFLSGNPWVCSCPLLDLTRKNWPMVIDKEAVTCVDDHHITPVLVSSLSQNDVHWECPGVGNWLRTQEQKVEKYVSHFVKGYTIMTFLGWALFVLSLMVIFRIRRKSKGPSAPLEVPYNVLDDKHYLQV